jgi:hypothetical protein
MLQFKTYLKNGVIRRCEVKDGISLSHWKRIIATKYLKDANLATDLFFSYVDDENEWILVEEEDEWRLALAIARNHDNLLKIRLEHQENGPKSVIQEPISEQSESIDKIQEEPKQVEAKIEKKPEPQPQFQPPQTLTTQTPFAISTPLRRLLVQATSNEDQQSNFPPVPFLLQKVRPPSPPSVPPSPALRIEEQSSLSQQERVLSTTQVVEANPLVINYELQIDQLREMGFTDEKMNRQVLEQHNGILVDAIASLIRKK